VGVVCELDSVFVFDACFLFFWLGLSLAGLLLLLWWVGWGFLWMFGFVRRV
jgi:hypothetical protein